MRHHRPRFWGTAVKKRRSMGICPCNPSGESVGGVGLVPDRAGCPFNDSNTLCMATGGRTYRRIYKLEASWCARHAPNEITFTGGGIPAA